MPRYKKNQEPEEFTMVMNAQGRVVIPAPMRRALDMKPGSVIRGRVEGGNRVVLRREEGGDEEGFSPEYLKAEKELWEEHERVKRSRKKSGVSAVEELRSMRREEARMEERKLAKMAAQAEQRLWAKFKDARFSTATLRETRRLEARKEARDNEETG